MPVCHIISSTFDEVSHAIKRKSCGQNKKKPADPPARISPVPSPVSCPIVSDDVQLRLQISNLKSLDIIHDAPYSNSLIFSNDSSVFYQNPVLMITRFATNAHESYHGASKNYPDPATVELRFRPRPQSNTIHPVEFKRFKLVVEVPESPGFFTNHHGTARIRADVSTLRLMPMHHDLINRVNRSSTVATIVNVNILPEKYHENSTRISLHIKKV